MECKSLNFKLVLFLSVVLFSICGMGSAFAQTNVVSGTVTDENNQAMAFASVYVKGTTNGVTTDLDGNYSISGVSSNSVLVFSFIGYAEQEIVPGNRAKIDVQLLPETNTLDEVVFVAYGTSRKGDVTGALTTIKPSEQDVAMPSVNSLLEGKIPGLVVSSSSSQVGSASSVTIRGASSLRGDNQPLYVIDNIPQASTGEFGSSSDGGGYIVQTDPLSSLNPADIVDITVLKDASSTAIYGSRGANGVILITTRKGSEGNARVRVNANFTVVQPTNLYDMIDLYEYADYRNSRVTNPTLRQFHVVGNEVRYVSSGSQTSYDPGDSSTYNLINYHNWQKEIYEAAFSQQYNVSVDGGTEKMTYYISAGFKDINGSVKNTGLQQGDLRANISAKLAKNVTLDLNLTGSIRENDMMAGGSSLGGATGAVSRTALDYTPFLLPDNDPDYTDEATTTVLSWLTDYVDKTNVKTFNGSMDLKWKITDNFRYELRVGGNLVLQDRKRWYGMTLYQGMNNNGYLAQTNLNRNNYTVENVVSYSGKVGDIMKVDATMGVTYDDYNYLNETTIGTNFSFYELQENGMSKAGSISISQPDQRDYQLLSYLARVNFSFLDKYLVTASFRADGSSKFAKGNRWGYFPSASMAWRIEQEEWMKDVKWVSQLKLRLSYGITGNQSIDPYSTFSMYGQPTSGNVIYADANGNALSTMVVTSLSNSGLKWEQTASWNLGIDFGLLKHRIDGTFDIYMKKTSDLLISRTLPGSSGYSSTYYNQGGLDNKGLELSLTFRPIDTKDWQWSISGNIGFNRSEITDLGLDPYDFGYIGERVGYYGNSIGDHFGVVNIYLAGEAPGLFYGLVTQGIVQESDITDQGVKYIKDDGTVGYYTTSYNGVTPSAGDIKFVDKDGDGDIDDDDKDIIGDPNPDFTYGFSTSVTWKRLTLTASFNGVQGVDRFNTNIRYIYTPGTRANNLTKEAYYGMWTAENPSNEYPSSTYQLPNGVGMDRFVEDASYLRCSDITIRYQMPSKIMKKIGFAGASFSFSAKNVFCITDYRGYDPEVNSFAFDGLRMGIDMSSYPNPRSYVLGVNLTF